jgi:predicted nucleic acid-binding protein
VTVFIDAGGWLSVTLPSDRYHGIGRQYFQSLISRRAVATTSDFVLQEVITRLRYDVGHRIASEFIALIHEAVDDGRLRVHRITPELWDTAEEIFLRYHDAILSFTDCTSFALLRENPVDEVFGYDGHFEMMGHILQPKA